MKMRVTLKSGCKSDTAFSAFRSKNILIIISVMAFFLSVIFGKAEDKLLMKALVTENMGITQCISLIAESVSINYT